MQAIILLGGFGTRLKSVLPDLPKPMAPIRNQPFLAHLLRYLQKQGITSVIFSVHYMHEKIQSYFQSQYENIAIQYALESEPLGTGGAIAYSLKFAKQDQPIFVLNGDTFVKLDYQAMYEQHLQSKAMMSMALRSVADAARYGKVVVENQRVVEFKEKGEVGPGFINAGVYLMNADIFNQFQLPEKFSIETDFIFPHLSTVRPQAFIANDYFIDIGIPEDYARAQIELPS